ncbi:hypothetical protein [Streptomyces sp. NPDC058614]|uniref:hypothetical protein n=1 Tax=Streptomyces sp. NPDC058614 TaxID=3346557 RepID=UPI00365B3AE4
MRLLEDNAVLVDGGSQSNARPDLTDPVQALDSAAYTLSLREHRPVRLEEVRK